MKIMQLFGDRRREALKKKVVKIKCIERNFELYTERKRDRYVERINEM